MNRIFKNAGTVAGCALAAALTTISFADGERDLTDKIGHRYVSNVSSAEVKNHTDKGYRVTDIEVVSTSPYRFSASMVKNAGPYQTGWWWKYDQTEQEMNAFLTQKQARIIDIETYLINGKRKYAFVALPNPSREFKEWWWFADKSWDDMKAFYTLKNGRLIDINVEVVKGKRKYSGVVIRNTGQDYRKWKVFSNITTKQIRDLMAGGDGPREIRWRLVDLERISSSKFAGILNESEGQAWWWFTDKSWEETKRLQGQFASRIFDIERRIKGGKARFDILLLNNANSLEWRMGQWLRGNSDGTRGFMLKEVNGSTKGSILPDFRTYAASTNKVLQHYYWSSRIFNIQDPLTVIPLYNNHQSDTHNQNQIMQWSTFQQVTQWMMWNSGNTSSNGIMDWTGGGNGVLGRQNLNSFAANTLGLNEDFRFFHKYADNNVANDPYNRISMRQLCKLYEAYANNVALTGPQRQWMHDNMLNKFQNQNTSFRNGILSVMKQEGNAIGMTNDEVDDVFAGVLMVWKGGNVTGYNSSGGWVRFPYKTLNGTTFRQFTVSSFIHDWSNANDSSVSGTILPEILRDEIAEMLETWI